VVREKEKAGPEVVSWHPVFPPARNPPKQGGQGQGLFAHNQKRRREMGTYAKWIILIIILLFFITFGVKNNQPVSLNYYLNIGTGELPLYGVIFISILVGIFIGMIMGLRSRLNLRKTVKNLQMENRELKEKAMEEKEEETEEE
jgi:putative membrane protein